MKKILIGILLFHFIYLQAKESEDLSYDDLLKELNYKKNRINKLNTKNSLAQNYLSLGIVVSMNQIHSEHKINNTFLQGFDIGYSTDLGSADMEGRLGFRYFFDHQRDQQKSGLQEVNLQIAQLKHSATKWNMILGGGFSFRHIMFINQQRQINELSTQLNGLLGLESKLSATSRLALELGARFPFGTLGQDRFSIDSTLKLKTEIE